MIDTTIPGMSNEIVEDEINMPLGVAGRVAIVGIFERADQDKAYFFGNIREAISILGDNNSYPGTGIIRQVFKQDLEQNNFGANSIICVQTGTRTRASLDLKDESDNTVLTLNAKNGGVWGNQLGIIVAEGTITNKKLVVKMGTDIVETFDNSTNEELVNKINNSSKYIEAIGVDLKKTLVNLANGVLAGGTENSSPTVTDLNSSLETLLKEKFDLLIFTTPLQDTYYPVIGEYLEQKFRKNDGAMAILPIDPTMGNVQIISLMGSARSKYLIYMDQPFISKNDDLSLMESGALYAGFIAGLPVKESPTSKIINNISGLLKVHEDEDIYNLVSNGLNIFELKNRENNKYGVISGVTSSQAVNSVGIKSYDEIYAIRILLHVVDYMNLQGWLGRTGVSRDLVALEGELENRKNIILDEGILESLDILVTYNKEEKLAVVNLDMKVPTIIKHINKKIKLSL